MALTIEYLPTAGLVPYARNARTHSEAQVAQIAASIREFGFCNPVLVDPSGGIIAGHGRVMAARTLGIDNLPCVRLGHLSETQRRAYVIADNQLALNAGWDEALLAEELGALRFDGFDLDLTGFNLDQIRELIDGPTFDPGTEDDQSKLDQLAPVVVTCPHCGWEFNAREQG